MTSIGTLRGLYTAHRFAVLLGTLIVTLVGHPLLASLAPGERAIEGLFLLSLIAAVASVEATKRTRFLVVVVGAFACVRLAAGALDSANLFAIGQALWASACLLTTGLLVREALKRGPVTAERIFAALDAYLLGAAGFGVGYWLLDHVWPASFGPDLAASLAPEDALYLSLVSISTLGFGDLLPESGLARSLVTLEAIAGQMYLAVLVARLVALYTAGESPRS
jgi:hypothetical protein